MLGTPRASDEYPQIAESNEADGGSHSPGGGVGADGRESTDPSSASATHKASDLSWKKWAGRRDGEGGYKVGDLSRRFLTTVQSGVRDTRHKMADTLLSVKEGAEKHVRERVEGLVEAEEEDEKGKSQGAKNVVTARERWWYRACQEAHRDHTPESDPAYPPEGSLGDVQGSQEGNVRGCLEVTFLHVADEPRLLCTNGENAKEPACQLYHAGVFSGALHLLDSAAARDADQNVVNSARFLVREIAGWDLQVNMFDKASSAFACGFEDKSFCGGAFVPLSSIIQRGMRVDGAQCAFEASMTLRLLPLIVLQNNCKLTPFDSSGRKRPKSEHGSILLKLKLTLLASPESLLVSEPVIESDRRECVQVKLSEPTSILKAVAASVARTGLALNMEPLKATVDELREEMLPAAILYSWWTLVALLVPVWTLPTCVALVLPIFSWKWRSVVSRLAANDPPRLYGDELPDPNHDATPAERVRDAVKGAAKVHTTLMNLTETLNDFSSQVEKAKMFAFFADTNQVAILGAVVLAASCVASVFSRIVLLIFEYGGLRYAIWLSGCCVLLPQLGRATLAAWTARAEAFRKSIMDDTLERKLMCFWRRLPDGIEAIHLKLCERYVLSGEVPTCTET